MKKSENNSLVSVVHPDQIKKKFNPIQFFENTGLLQIFLFWIGIILIFGGLYFIISYYSPDNYLILFKDARVPSTLQGLGQSIYFSFITATATGYGDITPTGILKVISIIEVILGLLIFGMIISKLVSYKQRTILEEVYEISFDEKVNRLRSALYLFRVDLNRIIERMEDTSLTKKKMHDINQVLQTGENTMIDIYRLMCHDKQVIAPSKDVNEFRSELAISSMQLSLKRISELLNTMDKISPDWREDKVLSEDGKKILSNMREIIKISSKIYDYYKNKILPDALAEKVKTLQKAINNIEIKIEEIKKD